MKTYAQYAKKLTVNDRKRLDELIEKCTENCEYRDVLAYMKEKGIKLEQECVQPKNNELEKDRIVAS